MRKLSFVSNLIYALRERLGWHSSFFLVILLLALCFTALPTPWSPIKAESATLARVYGRVVEGTAGQPLADARVIFWSEKEKIIVARVETDAPGSYEVEVKGDSAYWAY